jgi:hypothetical protein
MKGTKALRHKVILGYPRFSRLFSVILVTLICNCFYAGTAGADRASGVSCAIVTRVVVNDLVTYKARRKSKGRLTKRSETFLRLLRAATSCNLLCFKL